MLLLLLSALEVGQPLWLLQMAQRGALLLCSGFEPESQPFLHSTSVVTVVVGDGLGGKPSFGAWR